MKPDPRSFNTPELDCLKPSQLDNVGRAVVTLMREVAVLTDRLAVLEDILEQNNVIVSHDIETHQPSDACQERASDSISRMVQSVMDTIQGVDGAS